jgi:cytochrome c oxidase subunit 1
VLAVSDTPRGSAQAAAESPSAGGVTIAPAPIVSRSSGVSRVDRGSRLLGLLRTTDHKTIGLMYTTTALMWFFGGGVMAMLMRGELARSGLQLSRPSSTTS